MLVAVYGTLKKKFGNHRVMELARGEFIKEDYIELDRISGYGFPMATFNGNHTPKKLLLVEIYEVDKQGVEGPLDSLEGYYGEGEMNFYNRIEIDTLSGEKVFTYEINEEIANDTEMFFSHEEDGKLFYNWKN